MKLRTMMAISVILGVLVPNTSRAQSTGGYESAWEQVKQLAGTWVERTDEGETTISYHVTSGGSVVFEEFVGDTPGGVRDMATAYHLDGTDIVATHYCGAGNQPRMRSASYDPVTRVVRFDFWDITDLASPDAYHTTNIELYFEDEDNIELRFRGTEGGGDEEEWQVHRLRRETKRSSASDDVVAGAVEALPAELRAQAEVRTWGEGWSLNTVREGTNGMICLADRPGDERFQASCYHESLEPFMAAGRRLRATGLGGMEYQEARWAEFERGRFTMPDAPAMVYNFYHADPGFDARTDDPSTGSRLHALYLKGMTVEATGVPAEARDGEAWLMWPGKPSAHVMITPPVR